MTKEELRQEFCKETGFDYQLAAFEFSGAYLQWLESRLLSAEGEGKDPSKAEQEIRKALLRRIKYLESRVEYLQDEAPLSPSAPVHEGEGGMKWVNVPVYMIAEAQNALRMASNHLDSHERKTAMDRSIEYAERLMRWVKDGKQGEIPKVIPTSKSAPVEEGEKEAGIRRGKETREFIDSRIADLMNDSDKDISLTSQGFILLRIEILKIIDHFAALTVNDARKEGEEVWHTCGYEGCISQFNSIDKLNRHKEIFHLGLPASPNEKEGGEAMAILRRKIKEHRPRFMGSIPEVFIPMIIEAMEEYSRLRAPKIVWPEEKPANAFDYEYYQGYKEGWSACLEELKAQMK